MGTYTLTTPSKFQSHKWSIILNLQIRLIKSLAIFFLWKMSYQSYFCHRSRTKELKKQSLPFFWKYVLIQFLSNNPGNPEIMMIRSFAKKLKCDHKILVTWDIFSTEYIKDKASLTCVFHNIVSSPYLV